MPQFSIAEALDVVGRSTQGPCVSIVLPLEHSTKRETENTISLKNAVREVEEILQSQGFRAAEVRELLGSLYHDLERPAPWQGGARGFAVYISPDLYQTYSLPARPMRVCRVGDRFALTPLLQLHRADGRFAVLALNLKEVRLYEASRFSFVPVRLNGVPRSLDDYLKPLEYERSLKAHTSGTGTGKAPGTAAHGHYTGEEQNKKYQLEFFEQIDNAVRSRLAESGLRLVLAGVEYLVGLYRKQSAYAQIHEHYVQGSPERMDPQQLHDRAWEVVSSQVTAELEHALERFNRELGRNQGSVDLHDIVIAALRGQVDVLFADPSRPIWGSLNRETETVEIAHYLAENELEAQKNGKVDLLDLAVGETWKHRGEVFFIDSEQFPNYAPVSAVLRAGAVVGSQ